MHMPEYPLGTCRLQSQAPSIVRPRPETVARDIVPYQLTRIVHSLSSQDMAKIISVVLNTYSSVADILYGRDA